jgi:hypothetical protein
MPHATTGTVCVGLPSIFSWGGRIRVGVAGRGRNQAVGRLDAKRLMTS